MGGLWYDRSDVRGGGREGGREWKRKGWEWGWGKRGAERRREGGGVEERRGRGREREEEEERAVGTMDAMVLCRTLMPFFHFLHANTYLVLAFLPEFVGAFIPHGLYFLLPLTTRFLLDVHSYTLIKVRFLSLSLRFSPPPPPPPRLSFSTSPPSRPATLALRAEGGNRGSSALILILWLVTSLFSVIGRAAYRWVVRIDR